MALSCALAAVLAGVLPASAHAAGTGASAKLVRYGAWSARVPRSWPVYRLGRDPHACVRFNRHAVYLGRPASAQDCPAHAAGRTEAILV
ncbi:MAG: glycoside hydrolase domain-containing protein, partial [Solirubrobacteraceae bacterium]